MLCRRKDNEVKCNMNTMILYLYRDANNYKVMNEVIIAGSITEQQIDSIMGCLYSGVFFIPKQVDLPEKRFGEWTEDDHCWFELHKHGFALTEEEPDIYMTCEELTEKFLKAKGNWKDEC